MRVEVGGRGTRSAGLLDRRSSSVRDETADRSWIVRYGASRLLFTLQYLVHHLRHIQRRALLRWRELSQRAQMFSDDIDAGVKDERLLLLQRCSRSWGLLVRLEWVLPE